MPGEYQSDEDMIFDLNDDIDSGSGRGVAVIEREPAPAPAIQPPGSDPSRQVVPATPGPQAREPVEPDDDSQLVSDAISSLMRSDPRNPSRMETHEPQHRQQPVQPQQRQDPHRQDEPPLTPREAALLRDLREERQRRQELQNRLQPQQPQQPQRDLATALFEDPEQVIGAIQQSFSQQIASIRLEHDLDRAEFKHGETFKQAFAAFMNQVGSGQDRRTYERVMTADSPGEEIVRWHREQELYARTGGDLNAFEQQLRAQILAELQGQSAQPGPAPEHNARQSAAQDAPRRENGQFAPRHEVRLPTPTSRLSGSTAGGNDEIEDGSDDAIFGAGRSRNPRNR